jgi:hypothetical protein
MPFGIDFATEPPTPSTLGRIRAHIGASLAQLSSLIDAVRAPLPTQTGDGSELNIKKDPPEVIQMINETLKDLGHLGITDINTLISVNNEAHTGNPQNDKDYLMERLIQVGIRNHS